MAQAATAAEPAAAREALAFDQLEPSERVALARWLTVQKQWRDPTGWQTAADYDGGIVVDLQLSDGDGMIHNVSLPARYTGEAQRYALLNAARKLYGAVGRESTFEVSRSGLPEEELLRVDFRTTSVAHDDTVFCTPVDEVEVLSSRTRLSPTSTNSASRSNHSTISLLVSW